MNAAACLLFAICAVLVPEVLLADTNPASPANAQAVASKSVKKILVDNTITSDQLKQILARGYRPDKQAPGNEVTYCRREQLTGGRFQSKICKTAAQIFEDEQRGKDLTSDLQRVGMQTGSR